MKKQIANMITSCRILCSLLMLFFEVFSSQFYVLYLFCGFSDMIDGTIARKTNADMKIGAIFDSIADFIFALVSMIKILPLLYISNRAWIWLGLILTIKVWSIIMGFVRSHKMISIHTATNKITGLFIFLLPLTVKTIEIKYSVWIVCCFATVSAIHELYLVMKGKMEVI